MSNSSRSLKAASEFKVMHHVFNNNLSLWALSIWFLFVLSAAAAYFLLVNREQRRTHDAFSHVIW